MNNEKALAPSALRIATFNVSMEALNYLSNKQKNQSVTGNELKEALANNHQQIKNIAEIIQRVNPDIILLNEFDRLDNTGQSLTYFIKHYLNIAQQGTQAVNYPYFYQGSVNTGTKTGYSLTDPDKTGHLPNDAYGFGYFTGHFAMALLSKYPIDEDNIRTFQLFKWQDMPNALVPTNPNTHQTWYSAQAWNNFRLSSKSHWDIPIYVNGKTLHVLASHPTPPVFDGAENRNSKRNFDELRFWVDYLTPNAAHYIYDDNQQYGGLAQDKAFVILGDLNADAKAGSAIKAGIEQLTKHPRVFDPQPESAGGMLSNIHNTHAKQHTADWGIRADYVLPSKAQFSVLNSGIFWPTADEETFRLIESRNASSDHRLVWVDVKWQH